ncbi:MAG: right-handed parallel beta-helix repeat-containing protein, partial [Phycisphaerae bacterium]|nr:right-handed parallel beta-helix repeat-containing protein [Phycisphaerae bacterium]
MNRSYRLRLLVVPALLPIAMMAGPAWGQPVVYVDAAATGAGDGTSWANAFTSVQAGLNAAASGAQVWVASGTYVENISLAEDVALYGGFGGDENPATFDLADRDFAVNETILDGNQGDSVVTAPTEATETTRIDGFTITNGTGTLSGSSRYGGGLYVSNSSPTIANNTITGNSGSYGGGISCSDSSSPTIANNTITGNSGSCGGGISCSDSSSPTIANNTITGNSGSSGGGIHCSYASPTIANNTITSNSARSGGGICCLFSSPTLANTIVAFNSSGIYSIGGTPVLRHNCVYGNTAYNYSGLTDPTGTDGNISADPKLADTAYGNVHIQPDSPCRDAGDDAVVQPGWLDMDGEARTQGSHVDIGADESDGTAWPAGPYAIVRVRPEGDDANDGSSWALAKRTVQAGVNGASAVGGEVWVETGTYLERITLMPYAHVYGGFAGTETQLSERDWVANVTILDG